MIEIDDIAEVIADAVRQRGDALEKRIADLEAREQPRADLADALIDNEGRLVLTMSDGRTKALGAVVGKDGAPGATFTLDDFELVPLTERAFDFRFTHGGECHSFEVKFDVPLYRGVWKEGAYERGDMVTWAGSMWHCDEPKGMKPGEADSGWTLAVKAGRAGKDAGK